METWDCLPFPTTQCSALNHLTPHMLGFFYNWEYYMLMVAFPQLQNVMHFNYETGMGMKTNAMSCSIAL